MTTRANRANQTDIERLEAAAEIVAAFAIYQFRDGETPPPHHVHALDEFKAAWVDEANVVMSRARRRDRRRLRLIEGGADVIVAGGAAAVSHHLPTAATAGIVAAAAVGGAAMYVTAPDIPETPHPSFSTDRPSRRASTVVPLSPRSASPLAARPVPSPSAGYASVPPFTATSATPTVSASPAAGTVVTAVPTDTPTLPAPPPVPVVSPSPSNQHPTCRTYAVVILHARICLPLDGLAVRAG